MSASPGLEPVAIIGMSCRFAPDLNSPQELWSWLVDGASSVSEMPGQRWDSYAGSSPQATAILRRTTRKGSYLDDISGFDAEFFQITPREAEYLDPQQRMLLELAWEALGDAGVPPHSLGGTEAGVFAAANSNDYGRRLLEDLTRTGAWAVNGTTYYGIANRISYFLNLRGPSMAVDTACAGSLTALHVAAQSLRSGECPVAIVGGINIMATPALIVALDAAGATSPDGRSKAFDKAADGYGRGEGAGVMVLKKLSGAQRDGDRVRAVIVGSGLFQDGRSDGMMAPNSEAQEHMLREVYRRAGIDPATVGYVEAHGTGTPLGDVAEVRAIAGVLGAGRPAGDPLLFGSLKANIGHVEAASGIAGVIKAVLALEHGRIPASPHTEANPALDLDASGLRLVAETTLWPAGDQPRIAGISSYGVGGSIAHLVLREAPAAPPAAAAAPAAPRPRVFPLSATSDNALRALAGSVADWVAGHSDAPLGSVAHTLARRRSHLPVRGAVVAETPTELLGLLRTLAAGERAARLVTDRADPARANAVWVFSGHGAQWTGMGRELLARDPAFAAEIDALAEVFQAELGWTPRAMIESGGPWTVTTVQAMTFAMQVALASSWRSRGIEPAAVIGHSVGEIAAAVVAGALEREPAARFACRRAAALQRAAGHGAMALVGLEFEQARQRLAGRSDLVAAIAASPRSCVVSGDQDAVERFVAEVAAEGLEARRVDTDVAFHSPHVDEVLPEVGQAASRLSATTPQITLYSTALDDPRGTDPREGVYWETNLRAPVRFVQAVRAALADGARTFLEVSSHPVVSHSITETLDEAAVRDARVVPTLRRDQQELATLLTNLAALHCAGVQVDWGQSAEHDGDLLPIPAAHWQHRPYWIFPDNAEEGRGRGHDPEAHTLLGGLSTVAGTPVRQVWQTYLDMASRPYAQDHKVVGVETVPASVVINSFVAAAEHGGGRRGLADIVLRTPLAPMPPRAVQVVLEQNQVRLASRIRREDGADPVGQDLEWITHATATVLRDPVIGSRPMESLDVLRSRCPDVWTWAKVDAIFCDMGVEGYTFPWVVEELRRNDVEQFAVVTIDHTPKLHPSSWTAVIDGALTVSGVLVTSQTSKMLRTSSNLDSIAFTGPPPGRIFVHTTRSPASPDTTIDVLVSDDQGNVVCEATGLRFTLVQDRPGGAVGPRDLVHELAWEPVNLTEGATRLVRSVALLGDESVIAPLAKHFTNSGVTSRRMQRVEELADFADGQPDVVLLAPAAMLDGETPEQAAERCAWTLVEATQVVSRSSNGTVPPKVWCVTQGVRDPQNEAALAHAPLWGVSRIIGGERPDLRGGLLDLDEELASVGAGTAALILDLINRFGATEEVVSLTADGAFVARLARIERHDAAEPLTCRPDGTYLITGGLGGIGVEVARYLADHGARRLVLAGRRGLPPRSAWEQIEDPAVRSQIDAVLALEAQGVTVRVLALDVSDQAAVAAALDPSLLELPPIRGIVHAAGVVSNAMVDKTDLDDLRTTLGPKARGAMVLHRLFPAGTLDFFTLFSSCGQYARLTGQAGYAAANSFMDALASLRHAGGHTETTSLAWTQWRAVGMGQTTSGTTILEAESRGLGGISATEAFRSWAFADRFRLPYYVVLRVLPDHSLPVFSQLSSVAQAEQEQPGTGPADWRAIADEELGGVVRDTVHEQVATELNLVTTDIDVDQPLIELGVDSVLTVGLRVRLHRRFGIDLPPTILWSNPTVSAVADFLTGELRVQRESAEADGAAVEAGNDGNAADGVLQQAGALV
ncbi:MAG TPA: SDR family NAD(P)-dependent oxidoreductase [Actinocrinis sp.]|nr:SDR family NAD(P)-dependent oxidoreductase [Actinocrinis sp.]